MSPYTLAACRFLLGSGVRSRADVRAAMRLHVEAFPACHWCGRGHVEAHHVIPVHVNEARAADPLNLMSLCRRCHFAVGHAGDWRSYVVNIPAVVERVP